MVKICETLDNTWYKTEQRYLSPYMTGKTAGFSHFASDPGTQRDAITSAKMAKCLSPIMTGKKGKRYICSLWRFFIGHLALKTYRHINTFTHLVYICAYRILLHFWTNYVYFHCHLTKISAMQCNPENAYVNGTWALRLIFSHLFSMLKIGIHKKVSYWHYFSP